MNVFIEILFIALISPIGYLFSISLDEEKFKSILKFVLFVIIGIAFLYIGWKDSNIIQISRALYNDLKLEGASIVGTIIIIFLMIVIPSAILGFILTLLDLLLK